MRGKTMPQFLGMRRRRGRGAWPAMRRPSSSPSPSDNAGGGAPSDNTSILRHLIERNVEGAAVGPIWDPIAVQAVLRCR